MVVGMLGPTSYVEFFKRNEYFGQILLGEGEVL